MNYKLLLRTPQGKQVTRQVVAPTAEDAGKLRNEDTLLDVQRLANSGETVELLWRIQQGQRVSVRNLGKNY